MDTLLVYKSPYTKVRIGPDFDGGYVVCNTIGTYDGFLSGGIGVNIEFERHLLSLLPHLECIAFDGTITTLPYDVDRIRYVCKNLGDHTDEHTTTLAPYLTDMKDAFVKIDIEGHEYKLLPTMIANGDIHKVKQLLLEIHTPEDIRAHPGYYSASLTDVTHDTMFDMLRELNKTHRLVHLHANTVGSYMHDGILMPRVIECTYVRMSDYPQHVWKQSDEPIPSPLLDRPNNIGATEIELRGFPFNTL
jgi:hypothetical protein